MNNETVDKTLIRKCPLCGKEYLKPQRYCEKCDLHLVRLSQYEKLKINPVDFKQAQEKREQQNKTLCPYCNSTNVTKISTLDRAISVGAFGLASSKVGKQWHCNGCKSDF